MRHQIWFAVLLVACAACGVVEADLFSPLPEGYVGPHGGASSSAAGQGGAGTTTGSGGAGDLPCDVVAVLAQHCDSCHAANIPPILRSRADFLAPATDTTKNLGEASLERMQNAASPMPPTGLPPSADVAVFASWVDAGLPAGDCGGGSGGSTGSPYDTPEMCSSGMTWTNGDNDGARMFPGRACNACHVDERPEDIFSFAGTVYPTAHEPDDCLGVGAGDAVVEITDANGTVTTATTNSSGNFSSQSSIVFPATVRVVVGSEQLLMVTPLMSAADGDCNTCHNLDGINGAPGRIILPF